MSSPMITAFAKTKQTWFDQTFSSVAGSDPCAVDNRCVANGLQIVRDGRHEVSLGKPASPIGKQKHLIP